MPAANDHLAAALVLSGASGSTVLDFTGADYTESGSPDEATWWGGPHKSLWFRWTAASDGYVQFYLASGAPASWDIAAAPDGADFDAFTAADAAGLTQWAWQSSQDTCIMPVTTGDTLLLFVDDFSYETGSPPSTAVELAWQPWVPPPPAPVIGSWTRTSTISVTATRGAYEVWAGEDITVTGTDLDALTSVTIGGGSVPWDVISSTEIVLHVGTAARTGPIVVANGGGSSTTAGFFPDPVIHYPGPWISVSTADTEILSGWSGKYLTDVVSHGTAESASTQPAWDTVPVTTDTSGFVFARGAVSHLRATQTLTYEGAPPEPYTYEWSLEVDVLGLDATPTQYNMPPVTPSAGSWPAHVVNLDGESDHGTPTTDPTLYARRVTTFGEYKDNLDKDALSYPGDVDIWDEDVELRRITLPAPAYLPSRSELAALPLEGAIPAYISSVATVTTSDHASSGTTTNFYAALNGPSSGDAAVEVEIGVVPWTDWSAYTLVWLPVPARLADAAAVVIPALGPPHSGDSFPPDDGVKDLNVASQVRAAWTYQPPRYRFVYDEPPVASGWQVGSVAW